MLKLVCVFFCSILLLIPLACKDKGGQSMTGGWDKMDINSHDTIKSFAFLKEAIKKKHPKIDLLEVIEARYQVVAGTNYELTCKYQKGMESVLKQLRGVVYKDLQGKFTLLEVTFYETVQQ